LSGVFGRSPTVAGFRKTLKAMLGKPHPPLRGRASGTANLTANRARRHTACRQQYNPRSLEQAILGFRGADKTFQYGPIILPQFNSSCFRDGFHPLSESRLRHQ
jgi:hypothetical protein